MRRQLILTTMVVVLLLLAASDVDCFFNGGNAEMQKKRILEVSIMSSLILDMTILALI